MSVGSLSDLLKGAERRYVEVEVPELGTSFRLRSLTERERSSFEASLVKNGKLVNLESQKRRLLCLCLVDSENKRMLQDDQLEQLAEIDGAITGRLADAAFKLVGLSDSKTEEAEKN